ncbi:MAG TPA: MbcA/ParS/Xre antitoxin family protein [Bryobacteraceae bacterium]
MFITKQDLTEEISRVAEMPPEDSEPIADAIYGSYLVGGLSGLQESFARLPPDATVFDIIFPVFARAVEVFGDKRKASHWFATPLPVLDNHSPAQLLTSHAGIEALETLLTRIEHNIPS